MSIVAKNKGKIYENFLFHFFDFLNFLFNYSALTFPLDFFFGDLSLLGLTGIEFNLPPWLCFLFRFEPGLLKLLTVFRLP